METYFEVADILARTNGHKTVAVDSLDPACLLFHIQPLRAVPQETLFSELSALVLKMSVDAMAVAPGALVHSGFVKGFETERLDLVQLVPEGVKRVLDIGSAMGGYGKALKQERPGIYLAGVELNPAMAESALRYYDEVINRPIEEAGIRGVFDLINCGDILEHLQNPWKILTYLNGLLAEGGHLVLSIPNAGHWSIVRALLRGNFQYVPLGLVCIGHLRWFTESTIRSALQQAGFSIQVFQRQQIPATPQGEVFIRDMCTAGLGLEASLRTNEFTIRAVKTSH
jgi:SAM-dependent methyltransferase